MKKLEKRKRIKFIILKKKTKIFRLFLFVFNFGVLSVIMINAVMISLNDGRSLLFKTLNDRNIESFKDSGKIASMDAHEEYFLHTFSNGNEKIYAHTKNYKNFVVGVLSDSIDSLTNLIDKLWLKFEKYLISIDMINIKSKSFDTALFQPFETEIEKFISEIRE